MESTEAGPGPLESLAARLAVASSPPVLSALISRFTSAEAFGDFTELARQYLPEHEHQILGQPSPAAQVSRFAERFRERYFPLHSAFEHGMAEPGEEYQQLLAQIPVALASVSWDDWHEATRMEPADVLLLCLVHTSFDSDGDEEEAGARVALREAASELIPRRLLSLIPAHGYEPEALHSMLDGTRFETLAALADIWNHQTDTFFLDVDEESSWDSMFEWSPEEVENLTRQWRRASGMLEQARSLSEWLARDIEAHFKEILDAIKERSFGHVRPIRDKAEPDDDSDQEEADEQEQTTTRLPLEPA